MRTLTLLLCLVFSSTSLTAQDFVFTGQGDGFNWDDPINWDPAEVPEYGEVLLPQFSNVIIQGTSGSVYLDQLTLEPNANLFVNDRLETDVLDLLGNNNMTFSTRGPNLFDTNRLTVYDQANFNSGVTFDLAYSFGFVPQNLDSFSVIDATFASLNCGGMSTTSTSSQTFADYTYGVQCVGGTEVTVTVTGISYNASAKVWDGADGSWDNPSNWVGGVPSIDDYAVINDPSNCPTVQVNFGANYRSLHVGSCNAIVVNSNMTAGLSKTTSINAGASMNWTAGTIGPDARLAVMGDLEISGPQTKTLDDGQISGQGPISISGGTLNLNDAPMSIFNFHGSSLDIQGDGITIGQSSGSGTYNNYQARLTKSAGSGESFISTSTFLDSFGTIDVQVGTLTFTSGTMTTSSGTNIIGDGSVGFPSGFVYEGTLAPGGDDALNLASDGKLAKTDEVYTKVGEVFLSDSFASSLVEPKQIDNSAFSAAAAGTLSISGDLTTGAGADFDIDINGTAPGTEHDQLIVDGAADLSGTLNVALGAAPPMNANYLIMTAASIACPGLPATVAASLGGTTYTFGVLCQAGELRLTRGTLPVELASFAAIIEGDDLSLSWSTYSEQDNAGFEVQVSHDSENWSELGFVAGAGTTELESEYSFDVLDLQVGRYDFRLKQIDFDGSFNYSSIVEVDLIADRALTVDVFPNPASDDAQIRLVLGRDATLRLQLFDALGRSVNSVNYGDLQKGQVQMVDLDLSNLSRGAYFLSAELDGEQVLVQKVMKR